VGQDLVGQDSGLHHISLQITRLCVASLNCNPLLLSLRVLGVQRPAEASSFCSNTTSFIRLRIAETQAKSLRATGVEGLLTKQPTWDVIAVNHHQAGYDLPAWCLLQEIKEVAEKRRTSDADLLTLSVAAPYVTRIAAELTYDYKDR